MTILLAFSFLIGLMLAGFVGAVFIFYSAVHKSRSMPWEWLRPALICFVLSAWMRIHFLQLSLASKVNGLSMSKSFEKSYYAFRFQGAMFGFAMAGALAAAVAGVLMLARVLNRRSRPSGQLRPPPPEQRD